MRSTHELLHLLNQCSPAVKRKYYEACAIIEKKLRAAGHGGLNNHQCRYICEHLKIEKKMSMKELTRLSDGIVGPPTPPKEPTQESLFGS